MSRAAGKGDPGDKRGGSRRDTSRVPGMLFFVFIFFYCTNDYLRTV